MHPAVWAVDRNVTVRPPGQLPSLCVTLNLVRLVALTTLLLLVTGVGELAGHPVWLLVTGPSTRLLSLPSTLRPRRHLDLTPTETHCISSF